MVFQCNQCGKEYGNKFNFNYHVAHHSDSRPFSCDFPGCYSYNAYKTRADLRQHQKSHEKLMGITFVCTECGLNFDSSTKLNIHKRESHYYRDSQTWCDLCKRDFVCYKKHYQVVHEGKIKRLKYICDYDGKSFDSIYNVTRHIEGVHLKVKRFNCDQCSKRFFEASGLRKHLKHHTRLSLNLYHKRKIPPTVEDWGEDKEIEMKKIKYKCSLCCRKFTSSAALLKHEKRIHSSFTLKCLFTCDVCFRKFLSKRSIDSHLKTHINTDHQNTELVTTKIYQCGACDKILSSKHALKRHKKLIHLGTYDFICEHCSDGFRDRRDFNKHLEKYHNVKSLKLQTTSNSECTICRRHFKLLHNLEKHEITCRLKKQEILNQTLDKDLDANRETSNAADEKQQETPEINELVIKEEHFEDDEIDMNIQEEMISVDQFDCLEEIKSEPEESEQAAVLNVDSQTTIKNESQEFLKVENSAEVLRMRVCALKTRALTEDQTPVKKLTRISNKLVQAKMIPKAKDVSDGELENVSETKLKEMFKGETFDNSSESYACTMCSGKFEKLQVLRQHCVMDHRIKKFKCNHCNHSFTDRASLRSHWSMKHPRTIYSQSFHCRDYAIPNENASCPICKKIMTRNGTLKRHFELLHNDNRPTLFCDHCPDTFIDIRTLKNHMVKLHIEPIAYIGEKKIVRRRKTTKAISCEKCGEIVYGRLGLSSHQWTKHMNINVAGRKYHCTTCNEVLKCRVSAKRHFVEVHNSGNSLTRKCGECNKEFKLFDDFKKHIKKTHASLHICLVCGCKCRSSIQLFLHMKQHRAVPEVEKKLVCDLCGFKAQQKISIESHVVRYHGGVKKAYSATCEYCGRTFTNYQSFKAHSRTHQKQETVHCSYCGKTYKDRRYLRHHEATHLVDASEKPYHCNFAGCDREYVSYSSYRWHVKNSHKIITSSHQCNVCQEVSSSRKRLIEHCEEMHPELRRFSCSYCGKSFASQNASIRHMNKCEPRDID